MEFFDQMQTSMGWNGLLSIVITILCIWLSWWSLQAIRWEVAFKNAKSSQAKMLLIILSVIIGYHLARFILDYFQWSSWLRGIF